MPKLIEDILRNDPHIIAILPSHYTTAPDVDTTVFEEHTRSRVEHLIHTLQHYLTAPSVVHTFKDRNEQRDWYVGMKKRYGTRFTTFYDAQALRVATIAALRHNVEMLFLRKQPYQGTKEEKFAELTQKFLQATRPEHGYLDKSIEERLEIVANIKHATYQILRFLATTV